MNAIVLNSDGSVLIGGSFNALQAASSILLGGSFAHVGGVTEANLALLNADGSPNGAFAANANGPVDAVAVQANGQAVVAGAFSALGGTVAVEGTSAGSTPAARSTPPSIPAANGTVQAAWPSRATARSCSAARSPPWAAPRA